MPLSWALTARPFKQNAPKRLMFQKGAQKRTKIRRESVLLLFQSLETKSKRQTWAKNDVSSYLKNYFFGDSSTSSTRRLEARPSIVALSANGLVSA